MVKDKFDLSGKVGLVLGGRGYFGTRVALAEWAFRKCGAIAFSWVGKTFI